MAKAPTTQEVLQITDSAKEKIAELMKARERDDQAVRVTILGGHPSGGLQTEFKFVDRTTRADDDVVQDVGLFEVHFDPQSAAQLDGAMVDYDATRYPGGFHIQHNSPAGSIPPSKEWDDPTASAVQRIIDTYINPAIASHGGWVLLLDVKDDTAYIEMGGGCQGCAMSYLTLKQGIEQAIMSAVPEIKKVVDTTQHEQGTNPYYKAATGGATSPLS